MPQAVSAHTTSLSPLAAARRALAATIAASKAPAACGAAAGHFDLVARRDHLNDVLRAALTYARTIVEDTADVVPLGYLVDETGALDDAITDIHTAFDTAIDGLALDHEEAA